MSQLNLLLLVLLFAVSLEQSVFADLNLQQNVNRLRQMYLDSHKLANESMQEMNILRYLRQHFLNEKQLQAGAPMDQNGHATGKDGKLLVHLDVNKQNSTGSQGQYEIAAAATSDNGVGDDLVEATKKATKNSKSDARQNSLFSGFGSNPLGSNPLMNNLLKPPAFPSLPSLPTLPALPTFPLVTPRPSRPPKSSIIGNNGGPMSLTNDNVVVVNVLSGNY